jgi:hypothetical protein
MPASFEKSILKKATDGALVEELKPRKKKAKGPNPLSCKKKSNAELQKQPKKTISSKKKKESDPKSAKETRGVVIDSEGKLASARKDVVDMIVEDPHNKELNAENNNLEMMEEEPKRKKARRGRRGRTAREKREQARAKDALVPITAQSLFEDGNDTEGEQNDEDLGFMKEKEEMDVVDDEAKQTESESGSESESESEGSSSDDDSRSSDGDDMNDNDDDETGKEVAPDSLMELDDEDDPYLIVTQPKRDGQRYKKR